jgi:hypothetical protein
MVEEKSRKTEAVIIRKHEKDPTMAKVTMKGSPFPGQKQRASIKDLKCR